MDLVKYIRNIPDFPQKGILFRDITPLWSSPEAFSYAINAMAEHFKGRRIDKIAAIEARGFIVGAPLANKLNIGFVPVRKPGKLPYKTVREEYELEYGMSILEMHEDAVKPGEKVLVVDDLLATGGTAQAAGDLTRKLGGIVEAYAFLVILKDLKGEEKLENTEVFSLINF